MTQDQGWASPGGDDRREPGTGGASPAPAAPRGEQQQAPGGWSGPAGPPAPAAGWDGRPPASGGWNAPPRPGIVPLRPLGVTDLLEGGFRAISANPKVMLGVSALVFGGVAVLSLLMAPLLLGPVVGAFNDLAASGPAGAAGPEFSTLSFAGADPVTGLVSLVATVALTGILVVSVSASVIGRRTGAGELWRRVRGRLLALVGLSLLISVVVGAVVVLATAAGALGFFVSEAAGVVGLVLGLLAGVVLAVWLSTRWSLASVALLLEGLSIGKALRRSGALVKGTWWRVFGVLLLTFILAGLASAVLVGPASVVAGLLTLWLPTGTATTLGTFITLLFSTVASVLVQPFVASVTALLYTDLRIRQEGLDVELARAADEVTS